jgi:hypothetical protein
MGLEGERGDIPVAGHRALLAVLYGMLAVPLILAMYLLSPLWGRVFPP